MRIALGLALRHPQPVQALVLLEADPAGLSAEVDAWQAASSERVERASAALGVEAAGEAFAREALGEWEELPGEWRGMFAANGAAILAELRGDFGIERTRLAFASLRSSSRKATRRSRSVSWRTSSWATSRGLALHGSQAVTW